MPTGARRNRQTVSDAAYLDRLVALFTSRELLTDHTARAALAEAAMETALRLGRWDTFGQACVCAGSAYAARGDDDDAIRCFRRYLDHERQYQVAANHVLLVWYNLAISLSRTGRFSAGERALRQGIATADAVGPDQYAHGLRQALLRLYLDAGVYPEIPGLLAQSFRYLRHHTDAPDYLQTFIDHYSLLAEFALAKGRRGLARRLIQRFLSVDHPPDDVLAYVIHTVRCRLALADADRGLACHHAGEAIRCAEAENRSDLRATAQQLLCVAEAISASSDGEANKACEPA